MPEKQVFPMNYRERCYRLFFWLRDRYLPAVRSSQEAYEDALRELVHPGIRWLDLGCGHCLLPSWRGDAERELTSRVGILVGLDVSVQGLKRHRSIRNRVAGTVDSIPLADGSFDLVSANMVVEHLAEPQKAFSEVARVLRPGGIFFLHTPNSMGYTCAVSRLLPDPLARMLAALLEERQESDVFHTFYRANSSGTLGALAASAGLGVRSMALVTSLPELVVVPPAMLVELLWIRALQTPVMEPFRTNLIAQFVKG